MLHAVVRHPVTPVAIPLGSWSAQFASTQVPSNQAPTFLKVGTISMPVGTIIETPVRSAQSHPNYLLTFSFAGSITMPRIERPFPDYFYVDVPTVVKKATLLVLLICCFALSISLLTGFHMIHPLISIIAIIGCVFFYGMGVMLEKSLKNASRAP
jgi:hypothetical protein